jgi:hypothetical protein
MTKALQMPLINLAKSSYGWSPLWLHHKNEPNKKKTLGSYDLGVWYGEISRWETNTQKVQTSFLP